MYKSCHFHLTAECKIYNEKKKETKSNKKVFTYIKLYLAEECSGLFAIFQVYLEFYLGSG